jgi:lipoate-protein ligase B
VIKEKTPKNTITAVRLGLTDYGSAWDLQRRIFDCRVAGTIGDVLLLNEHHHVYTIGKSGDQNHLLANSQELTAKGMAVLSVDRGGDITYHGPGQLVAYPIFDLNGYGLDIHRYLRSLEEVIILTLAEYGIEARRDNEFTGVWVGSDKIAAIGVKVSRWVTMHGLAFNVNTDLSFFDRIIPCGIFDKGITSIERLTGKQVPMDEISVLLTENFGQVFEADIAEQCAGDFMKSIDHSFTENQGCLQA